ncbi:MAG: glycosyltransferase [Treponema sp.]|nr:glycosyltransferase [Treponema sp.]
MSNLQLSVCIITYNQEKYLPQALDSILNQEHNYSYEIIVGEDCSTDNTRKVLEDYATKYPDIIKPIYNNHNLGLLKNYYNVLSHCNGKYIMECAGDDYWLPGKVQKQISFMEQNNYVGLCYGKKIDYIQNCNKKIKTSCKGFTEYSDLIQYNSIPAASVCIRNELLKKYINEVRPLDKDWKMEDYPMWLWFSMNSKIVYMDNRFIVYRVLENSISHQIDIEKQLSYQKSVINIRNYYLEKNKQPILPIDEIKLKFDILINECLFNYNKSNYQKLMEINSRIKHHSLKEKLKLQIVKFSFLRCLYKIYAKK